jgi:hypothetical protein
MKIGYIVQGSTDRAFLEGLRRRWFKGATLIRVEYRGTRFHWRQCEKDCKIAELKECDALVILTDSDVGDYADIYQKLQSAVEKCDRQLYVLVGVAKRNIECWICADAEYVARQIGCAASDLRVNDPKPAFERSLGITLGDRKEPEIARLIRDHPPLKMMYGQRSFKEFYEGARDFARRHACEIPNELECR